MGFYTDNIHYFIYYANGSGYNSFEYYNAITGKTENKYSIYDGLIDCNNNLVLANGYYYLTLLKPTTSNIINPALINEKLNIIEQSSNLTIELTTEHIGNAELSITDLLGKNIYQEKLGIVIQGLNRFSINANLPVGIYICKININDYSISQKFQVGR